MLIQSVIFISESMGVYRNKIRLGCFDGDVIRTEVCERIGFLFEKLSIEYFVEADQVGRFHLKFDGDIEKQDKAIFLDSDVIRSENLKGISYVLEELCRDAIES